MSSRNAYLSSEEDSAESDESVIRTKGTKKRRILSIIDSDSDEYHPDSDEEDDDEEEIDSNESSKSDFGDRCHTNRKTGHKPKKKMDDEIEVIEQFSLGKGPTSLICDYEWMNDSDSDTDDGLEVIISDLEDISCDLDDISDDIEIGFEDIPVVTQKVPQTIPQTIQIIPPKPKQIETPKTTQTSLPLQTSVPSESSKGRQPQPPLPSQPSPQLKPVVKPPPPPPEPIKIQEKTPLPDMTQSLQPPQPQLPQNFSLQLLQVKSPDKLPYEITVWKNQTAVKVPPPPRLPPVLVFRVLNAMQTINEIKRRLNNDSDEIEAIEQTMKISLLCPITNLRVVTPSRSINCHHFDCFDINSFLEINYNKKIDDWKCPKCKQSAKAGELIIDSLLMHILKHKSVDSSVDSIIFDNKAFWVPDIKLPEIHTNQSSDSNVINIFDASAEDIIELDDDDDEDLITPLLNKSVPIPTNKVSNTTTSTNKSNNNLHTQRGEQELANRDIPQQTSRWSANKAPHNAVPPVTTFRPTINSGNQSSGQQNSGHNSSGQQSSRNSVPHPPQQNRTQSHTNQPIRTAPTTASSATNSAANTPKDCDLRFSYVGNVLTVTCPACNETFGADRAEEHKRSAKHKVKTSTQTSTTVPNNRTEAHTNRPIRPQNNVRPPNPRSVPVNNSSTRPRLRTYGQNNNNNNYYSNNFSNTNWNAYRGQTAHQPVYNSTGYPYVYPVNPSITNNFYTATPPYIQQIAPQPQPAHQSTNNNNNTTSGAQTPYVYNASNQYYNPSTGYYQQF